MPRFTHALLPTLILALGLTLTGCDDATQSEASASADAGAEAQTNGSGDDADATVLTGDEAQAAIEAGDVKPYPLDVCLVSGEPVGSMGDSNPIVYNGQVIKFCCPGCDQMLLEDPDKYLAKLDAQATSDAGSTTADDATDAANDAADDATDAAEMDMDQMDHSNHNH